VDSVRALLPELQAQLPPDVTLQVASDSTNSIRGSLREVELTLVISVMLVVLVVSLFLRSVRATIVPAVATVAALLGTFGVMYLLGFSLNNLSLMALTVATGFVVDDAIVVLENTSRHIESGMTRMKAALLGAKEVGFTVLSISVSLVAVFIPLLFMGGQVGRLFREFAVTLSAAVMISLVISLTTTPMMCAWLLKPGGEHDKNKPQGRLGRMAARSYDWVLKRYETSLDWALDSKGLVMLILVAVVGLNVYLFSAAPKGFFPQQDSGQLNGGLRADQSISSQALAAKLRQVVDIIRKDPAVDTVVGFTGAGRARGRLHVRQPEAGQPAHRKRPGRHRAAAAAAQRGDGPARVPGHGAGRALGRAREQLHLPVHAQERQPGRPAHLGREAVRRTEAAAGADRRRHRPGPERRGDGGQGRPRQRAPAGPHLDLDRQRAVQRLRPAAGGDHLHRAEPVPRGDGMGAALHAQPQRAERHLRAGHPDLGGGGADGDHAGGGIDRFDHRRPRRLPPRAARAPRCRSRPTRALRNASSGNVLSNTATNLVPLSAVAKFEEQSVATSVSHEDGELATTISFNLAEGANLGDAREAIAKAEANIAMPTNVRGAFAGTAASAQQSQGQQVMLILAALIVIYIVLGILYESLVHPITVLSTLPSAGVGAVLALLMFRMEFSIIALIGVFLLIGIVKKNAILIIDFALEAERSRGLTPLEAVREACLLRFRPILMTTLAAALGALPLAIGFGEGAELRRPLGVAIIGGLIASQLLTLLTTPVVYLLLDKLRRRGKNEHELSRARRRLENNTEP
jgi:multidrug efflux pump